MVKMASVIKKQQKIIEKLAQNFDPLDGSIGGYSLPPDESAADKAARIAKEQAAKKKPAPPKPPAPKPAATPASTVRQPTSFTRDNVRQPTSMTRGEGADAHPMSLDTNSADDAVPAEVTAALESGAPEFKNGLLLTVKGSTVDVGFNTDVVAEKAIEVQAKLKAALLPAGYTVVQCIGYSNPGWTPNF